MGNGANDLPLLLRDGIPQLLDEKKFPPVIKVNDTEFALIVLSPQFSRQPAVEEIKSFIDYAIEHYRIDERRIYLSGLSIGGTVTCDVAAAYPSTVAAIVPMSGVGFGPDLDHKLGLTLPRRSLYFRHAEDKQVELLKIFDGASAIECYQRSETIVPQQALALFNSELSRVQARLVAAALMKKAGTDPIWLNRMKARPKTVMPIRISVRGPKRSVSQPWIGPRIPLSARAIENAAENSVLLQPNSWRSSTTYAPYAWKRSAPISISRTKPAATMRQPWKT